MNNTIFKNAIAASPDGIGITKQSSFLILLLFFLSGCAVGPDYRRPDVNVPDSWHQSNLDGISDSQAENIEWWKTFKDDKLNSLVERAVRANLDLRLALGRLREARALRSGALWDLGPVVNTTAAYTRQQRSANSQLFTAHSIRNNLYDAGFDASWEIDIFGGKRRALEAATAGLAAAEEDRRDVLLSVLSEVARNYVDFRGYQQRLIVLRDNINAQSEILDLTLSRFEAGLSSQLDLSQAQAQLASTQSQLPTLETSAKQTAYQLAVLLGQEPTALLSELSQEVPVPSTPPVVPVGLPSELLRRRPDIRRAERQLARATANIGVASAEFFPKFNLLGTAGYQSFNKNTLFAADSGYWSIGPQISWRLLDFGRVRAEINAANAQQEQALAVYEQTILTAFQDVENALTAYANERIRFDSLTEAVAANRDSLDLSRDLYSKGLADFITVLDSERSLYQTEDQLADSRRAITKNLVTLYKALGGGWTDYLLLPPEQ